ncbi:MAG: penicillin acylase family protein [Bacteroidota bacterium]
MKIIFFILFFPIFTNAQNFDAAELRRFQAQANNVEIITDQWGIPHIYGNTDADAVFGLMYLQCLQNFERVERNYLEVFGRLAEVDGEGGVLDDLQMQLIYDSAAAKRDFENSAPWLKKLLNAFADGINFYLQKHPETKPAVFQRFQPWFPLMYTDGSISATQFGGITLADTKNLYAPNDLGRSINKNILYEEGQGIKLTGSNGFAIGPTRTASKNAILYINPHVTFYFRTEVHLVSNEGLNVYGAATWGNFFVYQGFNEFCGWMHTSSYADVADVYAEKIVQRNDSVFYTYNNKLLPAAKKQITIRFKKNGVMEEKTFTGWYTHHGPVMGSRNGTWLSLKERNRSLDALMQSWLRTKTKSFSDFKKVMELKANNSNNTVFAAAGGNIAYWHGNFMPKRNTKFNWDDPVDGTTTATEWNGTHAVGEIVQVQNPASGWIQNCNSTPFTAAGKSSPLKNNYPYYMAPDGENPRALNAVRLLSKANNVTLDDVIAIGYNRHLTAFDILLPTLFKYYDALAETDSIKQKLHQPINYLRQWNRQSSAESIATTVAIEWATLLAQKAPAPKNDFEESNIVGRLEWLTKNVSGKEQLQLLQQTVNKLTALYGTWLMAWGDINRYQRNEKSTNNNFSDDKWSLPSPLASAAWGALPSFNSGRFNGTKKRYGYSGNSFVAAVEFGKKLRAKTIITGGESFFSSSSYFTNQAEGFLNGNFKEINFYKEDVLKNELSRFVPGREESL